MNIFFIISSLLTVVVSQEPFLSCTYNLYGGSFNPYQCDLTIDNPNGFNNFTEIGGIHMEGFTNADVGYVDRVSGESANIPSIVCETFPTLEIIYFYNAGLTEIDDNTFRSCSRVTSIGLESNRIASISSNAFLTLPNISGLYLNSNLLTTLPADVFAAQQNLVWLDISSNPFQSIPDDLFGPLENLERLYLNDCNITATINQWFVTNEALYYLYLNSNRFTLTTNSFIGLKNLGIISLASNGLNDIPVEALAQLPKLQELNLYGNNISEIRTDSFSGLESVDSLIIGSNPIKIIPKGAFRELVNLRHLSMANCSLRRIESYYFEDLGSLMFSLTLSNNDIEDLPQGVFESMPNLYNLLLSGNRLKTLRRNSFGTLTRLNLLYLGGGNSVNAMDRAIIDDAVNLDTLSFLGNLCANRHFGDFRINRARYLPMLESCFTNMRCIVETVTEGDAEFLFFEAPNPGIVFRVNTANEIRIALTTVNFTSNPMAEIIIGSKNNTRSIIRMNQETNVVDASTPNIITRHQSNDFRITWANQLILVFSGTNTSPFMGYYSQDSFPINFYGLRSVETSASWSVQPIE